MNRKLRMGMVGGGREAFIGAVHRRAACLDGHAELVAGALSATPEKALDSGRDLGLSDRRNYASWPDMVEGESELPPDVRVDFVSIVTPNFNHYEIARAFLDAGIAVVCDKPLCTEVDDARQLVETAKKANLPFAVTYNYSGYPLVKEARARVRNGELGTIRKVIVEYNQGWLATSLERSGQKQAAWRTDPARAGVGGAIGDIGSHAEQLVRYVTDLEVEELCADLTHFERARRLDDDANLLLRFRGEARGVLVASQVCVGRENDLRLRVWGTEGGLEWRQEDPNRLVLQRIGEPERVLRRGNDYLGEAAKKATRLPPGHPEAFLEAFANIYQGVGAAIRKGAGYASGDEFDYPDVEDGARGVFFIERTVVSSTSERKWTPARWKDPS